MAINNDNYNGQTKLKDWWIVIKTNFASIFQGLADHTNSINNPHQVTKLQLGLDNVDNIQQATKAELTDHKTNSVLDHPNGSVTSEKLSGEVVDSIFNSGGCATSYNVDLNTYTRAGQYGVECDVDKINLCNYPQNEYGGSLFVTSAVGNGLVAITQMFIPFSIRIGNTPRKMYIYVRCATANSQGVFTFDTWIGTNVLNGSVGTDEIANNAVSQQKLSADLQNQLVNAENHQALTDNPHQVTKMQVGLHNVDNVQQATKAELTDHETASVLDHPDGSVTSEKLDSNLKSQLGFTTPTVNTEYDTGRKWIDGSSIYRVDFSFFISNQSLSWSDGGVDVNFIINSANNESPYISSLIQHNAMYVSHWIDGGYSVDTIDSNQCNFDYGWFNFDTSRLPPPTDIDGLHLFGSIEYVKSNTIIQGTIEILS